MSAYRCVTMEIGLCGILGLLRRFYRAYKITGFKDQQRGKNGREGKGKTIFEEWQVEQM